MPISVNNSNFTLGFFKAACQAYPWSEIKFSEFNSCHF